MEVLYLLLSISYYWCNKTKERFQKCSHCFVYFSLTQGYRKEIRYQWKLKYTDVIKFIVFSKRMAPERKYVCKCHRELVDNVTWTVEWRVGIRNNSIMGTWSNIYWRCELCSHSNFFDDKKWFEQFSNVRHRKSWNTSIRISSVCVMAT